MRLETLRILMCPYCGSLRPSPGEIAADEKIESGILACECSEFPVLGGIPIFKREGRVDTMRQTVDRALMRGPDVDYLLELIRVGAHEKALLLLLVPPGQALQRFFGALEVLPEGAAGSSREREVALAGGRRVRRGFP